MQKVNLYHTDLVLSNICYGTGNFGDTLDKSQAFGNLDCFVEMGGNFIDTANVYCKWLPGTGNSSEQFIGEWLRNRGAYQNVVIATKGGHYDFEKPDISRVNKEEIKRDLEESLRTLGLDCIDFYWLHRDDESKEVGEILEFMEELVKEGKIRFYGASNFKMSRLEEARVYAEKNNIKGFSAVSNQWSMASVNKGFNLNADKSLVMMDQQYYEWHEKHRMPMIPYSASAHGFFSKLERGTLSEDMKKAYLNERNQKLFALLKEASREYGVSLYCLTQAYFFCHEFQVFPVAAVSRPEQLKDFDAASELVLDKDWIDQFKKSEVE